MTRAADQAYHDRIARRFDAAYDAPGGQAYTDAFTRLVLERAPMSQGQLVLDVGCGTGRFTAALAKKSAARLVGLDHSAGMLRLAPTGTATVQGSAARMPFPDATFDAVFCFGVLHHVVGEGDPDCREALAEMRRVLRPGGRLVVVEPNAWNPYFFATTWIWHGLQERVAGYPRVAHERPLSGTFLRRALRQAGLRVDQLATAAPVEAFAGREAGLGAKAAQWLLSGPLRPFGTHHVAVATRPETAGA